MRNFYLDIRFFAVLGAVISLFLLSYGVPELFDVATIVLVALVGFTVVDAIALYRIRAGIIAVRDTPERLSNGDDNDIVIRLESRYPMPVRARVIDELPVQFQKRDMDLDIRMKAGGATTVRYGLRPVERGEYLFGDVNVFVGSPMGLVRRRYRCGQERMVPVYPSYLQMRRYELLAITNRLSEAGIKRVRRVGHTMEFDQIREYVAGDDFRTLNWKASARAAKPMVNQFQDEKAQHVYNVVDKGRVMRMPFEGMSLLDYAVNSSLVLSNIAVLKGDKAGLVTFAERFGTIVPADRRRTQMNLILEVLYNQRTNFLESDFNVLYTNLRRTLSTRSLVFLYTNFETLASLERQLPYIRAIARDHLLVVVFFENTELHVMLAERPRTTEDVYLKTIAEKFAFEKKLIVKELQRYGITSIFTTPRGLTVAAINKYLELKARRMI